MCKCLDRTITISRVSLKHNQELSPTKSRYFRCNKNFDTCIKRWLGLNDHVAITLSRHFCAIVVGSEWI